MALKNIILKKGYRTKEVNVPEWGASVIVREPLHVNFNRYIKTINETEKNQNLSNDERDLEVIKAESRLFMTILIDEHDNPIFGNDDRDDLAKSYGTIHTRLLNHAISLMDLGKEPIKEAEKK